MANSQCFHHLLIISSLLIIVTALIASSTTVEASGDQRHQWMWTAARPACDGSIAECAAAAGEFEMDSEINRPILATTTKFISYDVLKRDTVPALTVGSRRSPATTASLKPILDLTSGIKVRSVVNSAECPDTVVQECVEISYIVQF